MIRNVTVRDAILHGLAKASFPTNRSHRPNRPNRPSLLKLDNSAMIGKQSLSANTILFGRLWLLRSLQFETVLPGLSLIILSIEH